MLSNTDESIQVGQTIDYRLRVRGIPMKWQSLIEQWVPNECFVDTQVKGPYKTWHHTHRFIEMKRGTLIVDEVRYEVPGGRLGSVFLGPWIRSDVTKIFDYRRRMIERIYQE